jgi:hypothetical protein
MRLLSSSSAPCLRYGSGVGAIGAKSGGRGGEAVLVPRRGVVARWGGDADADEEAAGGGDGYATQHGCNSDPDAGLDAGSSGRTGERTPFTSTPPFALGSHSSRSLPSARLHPSRRRFTWTGTQIRLFL